jgi:glycosyltransferase involved in cell wall biosynthesis
VILIVVPTYNERENLPRLAEALLRFDDFTVLVVDDGSPDGTGEQADRIAAESGGRLRVMHRRGQRGLGRSYVDGFQEALRLGATRVVQMDADFSHDPNEVMRLIDATGAADLAIGSRYIPGGTLHNWPWHRVALSAFANRYVRAITGVPVNDCTSGFRCWRSDLLARVPLVRIASEGYAFQVEMAWHASNAGARIVEVPITFVERTRGSSKLSGRVIVESAVMPWRLRSAARGRRG